jgi:glucose/arabinose dehydrogenase
LRANPDGSRLELAAWGLRNPFRLGFDRQNRLFCSNHGMDVRGSRPVDNSPGEFQWIRQGLWYGWPDYTGGYPVTNSYFKVEGKPQPEFLLDQHPMQPPKPIAAFAPHSATMGFDFNYNSSFGPVGEVFIAEFEVRHQILPEENQHQVSVTVFLELIQKPERFHHLLLIKQELQLLLLEGEASKDQSMLYLVNKMICFLPTLV